MSTLLAITWADLSSLANVAAVLITLAVSAGIYFGWKNGKRQGDTEHIADIIANWKQLANSLAANLDQETKKAASLTKSLADCQKQISDLTTEKKSLIMAHQAEISQLKIDFDFERSNYLKQLKEKGTT